MTMIETVPPDRGDRVCGWPSRLGIGVYKVENRVARALRYLHLTSWPVPAILILATWRHQRRLARGDSEPCWLSSSRPSTPTTAPP